MTTKIHGDNLHEIVKYIPYDELYKLSTASCIFDYIIFNSITQEIGLIIYSGKPPLQLYDHLKGHEHKIIRLLDDIYFLSPDGIRKFGSDHVSGYTKYEFWDDPDQIPIRGLERIAASLYGNVAIFRYNLAGRRFIRLCRTKFVKKTLEGIRLDNNEFIVDHEICTSKKVRAKYPLFILEDTNEAFFMTRRFGQWDFQRQLEIGSRACHLVEFDVLWTHDQKD